MFDTDLYQQVLGLTAPWKVTDVGRHSQSDSQRTGIILDDRPREQ